MEFRIEVIVAATCYVKAPNKAEALRAMLELHNDLTHGEKDFELEPAIKLSPAMTIIRPIARCDFENVD